MLFGWALAPTAEARGARIVNATPVTSAMDDHATPPTRIAPRSDRSTDAVWIGDVLVYPPRSGAARAPVAVMLHGLCGIVENECPAFADAVAKDHWLVCPRGTGKCESGGGTMWSWGASTSFVESAVARVSAARPGEVAQGDGMLIGFSWGALVALDVAQRSDGKWPSLVLIAADVRPDAARLAHAGVRRVYMGAGNADMMKAPMMLASDRLARAGVASTFVTTGDVGHGFPRDMDRWVSGAVAWTSAIDAL
jgi:predicted esterase